MGFIGRYFSKLITLAVAFASCSMLICRSFLQSHSFRRRRESDGIVPMFCTVHDHFIFIVVLKIVLARGSCDIFPTHAYDRNCSRAFSLLPSDDRSFNIPSRFWRYSARRLALALY